MLSRTTGVIDRSQMTICGWMMLTADNNAYSAFCEIDGASGAIYLSTNDTGTTFVYDDTPVSGGTTIVGPSMSLNTWYFVALVTTTTDRTLYWMAQSNTTLSSAVDNGDVVLGNSSTMRFFNDQYASNMSGRISHLRLWAASLTADELMAEALSDFPVRIANLNSWYPMNLLADRTIDKGGNGYTLTTTGTFIEADGAPVPRRLPFMRTPYRAPASGVLVQNVISTAAMSSLAGTVRHGNILISGSTRTAAFSTVAGSINIGGNQLISNVIAAMASSSVVGLVRLGSTLVTNRISSAAFASLVGNTIQGSVLVPTRISAARLMTYDPGYSLRFYGVNSGDTGRAYIELDNPSDPPIDIGAGDFTVEFYMNCLYADNTTSNTSDARYANIIVDHDVYDQPEGWVIGVTRNGSNLVPIIGVANTGLTWASIIGTTNVGDGAWHHIAMVRTQSTGLIRLFVDRVQQASGTYQTSDMSYENGFDPGSGLRNNQIVIGTEKHDLGFAYTGYVSSVRVSNNARYTSTFSQPGRWATDANTVGLYLMAEGSGTTAADTSGVSGSENMQLVIGGTGNGPTWHAIAPKNIWIFDGGSLVSITVFDPTMLLLNPRRDLAVYRM